MTKFKLFHAVDRKMINFRDKLPFMNSMKSLIFDSTNILLPKRLVFTYSLIVKVMHYQIPFTESKSSYQFLSYVQFRSGGHFSERAEAARK